MNWNSVSAPIYSRIAPITRVRSMTGVSCPARSIISHTPTGNMAIGIAIAPPPTNCASFSLTLAMNPCVGEMLVSSIAIEATTSPIPSSSSFLSSDRLRVFTSTGLPPLAAFADLLSCLGGNRLKFRTRSMIPPPLLAFFALAFGAAPLDAAGVLAAGGVLPGRVPPSGGRLPIPLDVLLESGEDDVLGFLSSFLSSPPPRREVTPPEPLVKPPSPPRGLLLPPSSFLASGFLSSFLSPPPPLDLKPPTALPLPPGLEPRFSSSSLSSPPPPRAAVPPPKTLPTPPSGLLPPSSFLASGFLSSFLSSPPPPKREVTPPKPLPKPPSGLLPPSSFFESSRFGSSRFSLPNEKPPDGFGLSS